MYLEKPFWSDKWNLHPCLHVGEISRYVIDNVCVIGRIEAGGRQHDSMKTQMGRPCNLLLERLFM